MSNGNGIAARKAIETLIGGKHLNREEARKMMSDIMDGLVTQAQIGSLLTALRMKGETEEELTSFAEAMRQKAAQIGLAQQNLLDTAGTGGDGANTFNISTASAIVAAAGGVRVAKHGNRAVSSKSGSADVLEALGVNISLTAEQAIDCLNSIGICFMFAQLYHPSMKYAASPRKDLGVRTVFNLLGPLTNPAGADHQLLGVFDRNKTPVMASVLRSLGLKRALVVSSLDGLDEISISQATQISELKDGKIRTYEINPDHLGLGQYPLQKVKGGNALENAEIINRIFEGEPGACRDIVLANSAACFYVAGKAGSLQEGVKLAKDLIDSGKARQKLQELVRYTRDLSYVS
ncbi:anthranilate phosphoribosyltransferase [Paenibacillus larvae]|uniref:anthranilate phosphoribosyltransferase n=1 Tax=Paenibacillus larvae TaxID=1464 RepID=UPI0001694C0C|nr:anthranilate phosphoribosyltransferase [Paenibacillus larvae]AQR79445.1 anthranilate phosphoribosyltransferase [Paenibacillus larvae subsp. larvae]AVF23373.1 anthranilate phosphoribosyltransferase TrpD [Paenibacillus larvae subsp. larvae]MCY7489024.1 anthranilate phosphoribosyltransferase [Paenibacillus larvae]MCY9561850.1 anthranilate phosphoribosyltransferase [Paenibacillus larvae]MCY9566441.1 anthranilate phosphoribosyltransferase [Paenibacillus larvae]